MYCIDGVPLRPAWATEGEAERERMRNRDWNNLRQKDWWIHRLDPKECRNNDWKSRRLYHIGGHVERSHIGPVDSGSIPCCDRGPPTSSLFESFVAHVGGGSVFGACVRILAASYG